MHNLPTPLGVLYAGTTLKTLLLLQHLRRGSWVFLVFLYLFVHNWPQLRMHTVSSLRVSLYFVAPEEETFVQLRALQQKAQAPGPRLSQCCCKDRCISRRTRMCSETGAQRQAPLIVNKDTKVIPWERTVCSVNSTGKNRTICGREMKVPFYFLPYIPASRTAGNEFLLCISHPACDSSF